MDTDLDTLATAIYVSTDDLLKARPDLVPWRSKIGMKPLVSDAELVTLAVLWVILGFNDEARWVRHIRAQWRHLFPYLPHQSGYNKRVRRLGLVRAALIEHLAAETSVAVDDVLVVDSIPVECARSRETVKRSDLAGGPNTGTAPRTPATSGGYVEPLASKASEDVATAFAPTVRRSLFGGLPTATAQPVAKSVP